MKKIILSILLAFSLVACSDEKAINESASMTAKSAIAAAKVENLKARSLGFEWKMTGKMLSKASKLAKLGKEAEAIKLANQVKRFAILGQKQAETAKTAGPSF